MPPSPHTVLTEVVSRHRETGEPVTAEIVAGSLGIPRSALSQPLESLCQFDLLEETDRGYRPTVTAEELLALDIELNDVLIIDPVED